MVTLDQAKEYLEDQGITIHDFVLQAFLDEANSIQDCLDAHYPTSTAAYSALPPSADGAREWG